VFDDALSRCVATRADAASLRAAGREAGLVELHSDGLAKAAAGITSLDEVFRVAGNT